MNITTDIAIIGGSAAGTSAAAQARRINPSAEITVFEEEEYFSYSTCALPYYISGIVKDHRDLISRTKETFKKKENISVFNYHRVKEIKPSRHEILVTDLKEKRDFAVNYSSLIIAAGAKATVPPVPGISGENIFTLRNLSDAVKIRKFIETYNPSRAVITGGGFIALQLCEAFSSRFIDVAVIEQKERLVNNFDEEISDIIENYLKSKGVKIFTGETLRAVEGGKILTDRSSYPFDMLLICTGVKPSVELASQAGISTGLTGAVKVDERTCTNMKDIYSCGNCAEVTHLITGKPAYYPLGTYANKQGKVSGSNGAGKRDYFPGVLGTSIVKTFDMTLAKTGLSHVEAALAGYKVISEFFEGLNKPSYYPGAKPIYMKLMADKNSGKILGAQITGQEGADKRIDLMASAMTSGMTLEEFYKMDLSYSCPYSTVIDFTARSAFDFFTKLK